MPTRRRIDWLWFVVIGMTAGFLSGLFGVGGGILIVPLLVSLARFEHKRAAGTSLAAIVPTAITGVISYAVHGDVSWLGAVLLAIGSIVGAQIGAHLLHRLPRNVVQWAFIVFIGVVIVSLFLVVPSRDSSIAFHPLSIAGLVLVGLVVGVLSGLLGIGGGVVIVPVLIVLFGASDLEAKATSLLVMIPTGLSGTVANARRRNVDIPAAIVIGLSACALTVLGSVVARTIPPQLGSVLFALFLVVIAVQMIVRAVRSR